MTTVKRLDDLKKIREEALQKQVKSRLNLAKPGDRWHGYLRDRCRCARYHESDPGHDRERKLAGCHHHQTGCIGLCEKEPIVQVKSAISPRSLTAKVTPEVARKHHARTCGQRQSRHEARHSTVNLVIDLYKVRF